MSDEKRREELKAKINEQLDKFSIEDLERIAGGAHAQLKCPKCGANISWSDTKCPNCGETVFMNFFD